RKSASSPSTTGECISASRSATSRASLRASSVGSVPTAWKRTVRRRRASGGADRGNPHEADFFKRTMDNITAVPTANEGNPTDSGGTDEARFRALIEANVDGLLVVRPDGTLA